MKYDIRMGIAHDTLYYGVLYFNTDKIKSNYQGIYGVKEDHFRCFNLLRETIPNVPVELYPFFYFDLQKPTFMSDCFFHYFHFGEENFPSFLERAKKDSLFSMQHVFQYYLNEPVEPANLVKKTFIKKILKLDFDENLSLQLINLWAENNRVYQMLFDYLMQFYEAVSELYEKEKALLNNRIKLIESDHFLQRLTVIPGFEYSTKRNIQFSVSLLNVLVVLQKGTAKTGYKLILGQCCHENLHLRASYGQITPDEICAALGDPIKAGILKLLNTHEYTATQLAEILVYSRQTVNRHLLWLLDYMFIVVTRKVGPEIYYSINRDFFAYAEAALLQYIREFKIQDTNFAGGGKNEALEKAGYM